MQLSYDSHITILDKIDRQDILDYEDNYESSSDDDSVEPSREESSQE